MKKLFFLIFFVSLVALSLKADENPEADQGFIKELNNMKSPFEDGIPKPVIITPVVEPQIEKPVVKKILKPNPVTLPVSTTHVTLPLLNLQGVVVGDGVHEAIINGRVVSLKGYINGAQLVAVEKQGVELLYKGKKFFLKID